MKKEQFESITKWQKETFGQATALSKALHLQDEVEELIEDLKSGNKERKKEYADCFILLFGSADADGMTYEDIISCIDDKMVINRNRKWGKPKANGVVNHLKD